MPRKQQYTSIVVAIFAALTIAVIAFTFYETIRFSVNFGIGSDEATYIIQNTLDILAAKGWQETILTMLPVHERHVLLGMTISNLVTYWTLGRINFSLINAFNVVLLCGAGLLLLRSYSASRKQIILLAAIVFPLILSPVHNECMLIAACTGNHYFGLVFSVAALYFFSRTHSIGLHFIIAEICSACAVLSFAGGIVAPIAGLYLLWKSPAKSARSMRLSHFIISTLLLTIYYWLTHPVSADLPIPPFSGLHDILFYAVWLIGYTISLIGTPVIWLMHEHTLALFITGFSLTLLFCILFFRERRFLTQNPLYLAGVFFFLGMLMMVAFGRWFGPIAPRYAAYNIFFLLFIILLFFRIHDDRCDKQQQPDKKDLKYYILACVVLIHYSVALYYHLPFAYHQEKLHQVCVERWYEHKKLDEGNYWCAFSLEESYMRLLIKKAGDQGVYSVEK